MGPVAPDNLISSALTLKPKISYGHDNISNKLLKETMIDIALPLSHIFNLSFSNGIVPT